MMALTSEKDKMLSGQMYNPMAPQLVAERHKARELFRAFNQSPESATAYRWRLLWQLLPNAGGDIFIEPPFYCDYGYNIHTGQQVFFNFDCVVLDVAPVYLGSRLMCAPKVQLYTATHPLEAKARYSGKEYARSIHIGEEVWLGGGVIVCPGVRIGDRSIIGAGSVVTRDVPPDVFAAGNPCQVIRKIEQ